MDEENEVTENEQPAETGEQSVESDPKSSEAHTVETQQIDYTDQLMIIQQQQQISIGVSCVLCGLLLVSIIFNVLKRYIG